MTRFRILGVPLSYSRVVILSPHTDTQRSGGVRKLSDYGAHLKSFGVETVVQTFQSRAYDRYRSSARRLLLRKPPLRTRLATAIHPREDDLILFSWPPDIADYERILGRPIDPSRVVHLVQDFLSLDTSYLHGLGSEVLARPYNRWYISETVAEGHSSLEGQRTVIPLGIDLRPFSGCGRPSPGPRLRIGYTDWKSDIGVRVAHRMRGDAGFIFEGLTGAVSTAEFAEFLCRIDVFLASPLRVEGFYLPGLEAQAAGALVVSPDVRGNRAYVYPDVPRVEVWGDVVAYRRTLTTVAGWPREKLVAVVDSARTRALRCSLARERSTLRRLLTFE